MYDYTQKKQAVGTTEVGHSGDSLMGYEAPRVHSEALGDAIRE